MPKTTPLLRMAALGCALMACALPAASAQPERARASVDTGVAIGASDGEVAAFKGLPYAAPPVGDRRWRPPAPAARWAGELQALDYGPSCPQKDAPHFVSPASRAATTSEDCLTLNVWAPAKAAKAPVVVWIHGGGNVAGTASEVFYSGAGFARDGVVLVSFNYRLGLLGFLADPALGEGAANFALLDQIAALQWVKRNVQAFGGDPGNVTVMGESAGGQDILALMASPAARGLFDKAIVESPGGGWDRYPSLAQAQADSAKVAAKLGARTAADLRKLTPEALVQADEDLDTGPILDGVTLTQSPIQALGAGRMPAIPLLIGSNSADGSLLPDGATLHGLDPRLSAPEIAGLHRLYGEADETALARLVFRDSYFAGPSRWIAAHWLAPAYLYRFDYVAQVLRGRRSGATHGSEIPFVFQTAAYARAPDDRLVASLAHACWVAFIKTGVPACDGAPAWPAYRAADDRLMLLDVPPEVVANPAGKALDILAQRLAPDTAR